MTPRSITKLGADFLLPAVVSFATWERGTMQSRKQSAKPKTWFVLGRKLKKKFQPLAVLSSKKDAVGLLEEGEQVRRAQLRYLD